MEQEDENKLNKKFGEKLSSFRFNKESIRSFIEKLGEEDIKKIVFNYICENKA